MLSRRQYLRAMLAAGAVSPALLSLAGCGSTQVCPDDPNESAGVDWTPDILHPMFWGFQDLDTANGAPGPLRIYYPTYEGTPQNAPILKLCLIRYPVVLFTHGQAPCVPDGNYFKRWQILGMVLARSGYVVVMPQLSQTAPTPESPDIAVGLAALDFVRNGWEHRNWVDSDVTATTVGGHSFGALLAARIHKARPTIGAYFGLSGVWTEVNDTIPLLQSIQVPAFLSWGTLPEVADENMDSGGLWQAVPGPKWAALFPGFHFDYITPPAGCTVPRGVCNLIELVMAELIALFVSRQVPVKTSHAPIPPSLIPPAVTLTPKQEFFAGSHLNGIGLIESRQGCGIDLRWEDPLDTDSRHLGP